MVRILTLRINRSRKEIQRLHRLNKPVRHPVKDDLPDVSSHSEDDGEWSSNIGSEDSGNGSSQGSRGEVLDENSDLEMPYEVAPRPRRPSWDGDSGNEVQCLPVKLSNGQIKNVGIKMRRNLQESSEGSSDEDVHRESTPEPREDALLGEGHGLRSGVDMASTTSRKKRIDAAKEKIATICQEIVGDPEDSVRWLFFCEDFRHLKILPLSFHCSVVCTALVWRRSYPLPTRNLFRMIQRSENLPYCLK